MIAFCTVDLSLDNGNVHRAAANIIVSKSHAARGSVCNVLLSRVYVSRERLIVTHFTGSKSQPMSDRSS